MDEKRYKELMLVAMYHELMFRSHQQLQHEMGHSYGKLSNPHGIMNPSILNKDVTVSKGFIGISQSPSK